MVIRHGYDLPPEWHDFIDSAPDGPGDPGYKPNGESNGAHPGHDLLWWYGDKRPDLNRSWRIEGLLPTVGTALISGQWGTYKTFLALDLSLALMMGGAFAGRKVIEPGGVLYIAKEGAFEIPLRLQCALEAKFPDYQEQYPGGRLPFAMAQECPRLLDRSATRDLICIAMPAAKRMETEFHRFLSVIIIDTLAAAALFNDETDNAEAHKVLGLLDAIARELKCLVVAVDHFGKDVQTGTRGASAKEDRADTVLAVLGDKELSGRVINPRMAIRKVRGAKTGGEVPFGMQTVEAADGETTLVVDWRAERRDDAPRKQPWPTALCVFRDALLASLDGATERHVFGDGPLVKAVNHESVRAQFYRRYAADGDSERKRQVARRQAFNRGLAYARERNLIGTEVSEDVTWVWQITT